MNDSSVVVAGATGNLGGRIVRALLERGASIRALVRRGTARDRLEPLEKLGITIASVDLSRASQVASACSGASCVVSALSGLRDVIVEAQTVLLDAAINAGVPRFIPSDYSIDFTKFPPGENRRMFTVAAPVCVSWGQIHMFALRAIRATRAVRMKPPL